AHVIFALAVDSSNSSTAIFLPVNWAEETSVTNVSTLGFFVLSKLHPSCSAAAAAS
ncbi:hypothetical protein NDU88_011919, partial [Pleurodeles waltl]